MFDLINNQQWGELLCFLQSRFIVIGLCYMLMLVACFGDMFLGIKAALAVKERISSHRFRRTANKAIIYGFFIWMGTTADIFFALGGWNILPYGSITIAAITIVNEFKSYVENYIKMTGGQGTLIAVCSAFKEAFIKKSLLPIVEYIVTRKKQ